MRTKAISLATFATAALYSFWKTGAFSLLPTALCLAAALFVDMGTTAFNSYFDYLRGVDRIDTNKETDKVLVHEGVPPGLALGVAAGCFAAAGILGIILAFLSGIWILLVGAASLAAGFLYSGGPKPISRGPLGELTAGCFLGTVLFLIVAKVSSGGSAPAGATIVASRPGAFLVASILAVNNLCDVEGDRQAGRRTLPIAFGPRYAKAFLYTCGLIAFGLPAIYSVLGVYPPWSALGSGLAAAIAFPRYLEFGRRGFSHATKSASMKGILGIFLLWGAGMTAGFTAALLIR
jgi:1,4-dihydroxy-2-naphthoate octaprenyltransferase